MANTTLEEYCIALAQELGLNYALQSSRIIFSNDLAPIIINIEPVPEEPFNAFIYFYVRTTSYELPGERTDANELISVLFAAFLRIELDISSSLVDIPHPVDVPETEVYARYIIPNQPFGAIYSTRTDTLKELLIVTKLFGLITPTPFDWTFIQINGKPSAVPSYDWVVCAGWAKRVAIAIGEPWLELEWSNSLEEMMASINDYLPSLNTNENIQFASRTNPNWKHYRSIATGVTFYESPRTAAAFLKRTDSKAGWDVLDGIKSKLYVSPNAQNAVLNEDYRIAKRLILDMSETIESNKKLVCIPLENYFVVASEWHLVFLNRDCGKKQFEKQREQVRNRHQKESALLFPATVFFWNDSVDDAMFESMVLELLRREPGVTRARLVSVARERDGGKDILCEWLTPPIASEQLSDEKSPVIHRRVIVQCKAFRRSVGKLQVTDIRDTVEHHDANGYFLAVSSQITTTLTDHLDKIRRSGDIWVDWWTRNEIEERLSRNLDIAEKYKGMVNYSKT